MFLPVMLGSSSVTRPPTSIVPPHRISANAALPALNCTCIQSHGSPRVPWQHTSPKTVMPRMAAMRPRADSTPKAEPRCLVGNSSVDKMLSAFQPPTDTPLKMHENTWTCDMRGDV